RGPRWRRPRPCHDRRVLDRDFAWKGDRIRWARFGAGPPLVLCHGTPWSSALWGPIARALADRFTVHLWDMRGFGTSTMAADQDVSLGEQGQLFAELVRHWRLPEPPRVVAHDIGGAVALRAAPLHEALVRAYIAGAAHRPLPPAAHDALTAPWLGPAGQPAFYRQIAQAD